MFHHIAYETKANLIRTPIIFTERKSDLWFESYSQNSFGNSKFLIFSKFRKYRFLTLTFDWNDILS